MKTVEIARSSCTARRLSGSLLAFGVMLALALSGNAQTVTTLGGGPNTLPVTPENSHGSGDGLTRSGTDAQGGNKGAQFYEPYGMALDSLGNLYIADRLNGSVRKVSNTGNLSTSFTSTIITGLNSPVDIKVDSSDTIYVLTQGDGAIRRYNSAGTLLGTITTALTSPTAFTIDSTTNSYVTESGGALKKVTLSGVGAAGPSIAVPGAFVTPRGIDLYGTNALAVSDSHRVQIFSLTNNTVIKTYGGLAAGFSNGLPDKALFNTPYKVSTAPNQTIVVADRLNNRVRYISPGGTVGTLYGVPTNQWNVSLPGFADGTNAHSRDPVGVLVPAGGTNVFTTEVAWNVLRTVGGVSYGVPAPNNTNTVPDVGSLDGDGNYVSFGFQSGEGSSTFRGSPGQFFTAPVTLVVSNTAVSIYSLGFTLALTNVAPAPSIAGGTYGFSSLLQKPAPELGTGIFTNITPQFVVSRTTNITFDANNNAVTNIVPAFTNGVFTSIPPSNNFLGVSWLELKGKTNLYDTTSQDLITYSQAHINQFSKPNALVGAFGFRIPTNAVNGQSYLIRAFNASGEAGLNIPVDISAPTNGSLGAGIRNSLKRVTVEDGIQYLVGDISTFRWFNAGDFGNGTLDIDDAQQTFMSSIYGLNYPPFGTDFFDAMDSSNGSTNLALNASSGDIDSVLYGDGELNVDDVFVTLRRYILPFKWYNRYWSNGILNAVEVPNKRFNSNPFGNTPAVRLSTTQSAAASGNEMVEFSSGDAVAANGSVTVPIYAKVFGNLPVKAVMIRLSVKPLDGSPYLTQPVQFQFMQGTALGTAFNAGQPSPSSYFGVWVNVDDVAGLAAGTHLFGNLVITLPPGAPATAAYSVHFDHVSSSPNGIALFPETVLNGLITTASRNVSSKGDGIPDSWRLRYFGTLNNVLSDANADADGDGVPNWAEYKAGTDPNDSKSQLRVHSFQKDQTGSVVLRWPTVTGKTYQIEYSTSIISDTWTSAGTVTGTGGEMEFRDTNSSGQARFFRVRLVEPNTQ